MKTLHNKKINNNTYQRNRFVFFARGMVIVTFISLLSSTIYAEQISVKFKLTEGWNTISLPVKPETNKLTELFSDCEPIYLFNGSSYQITNTMEPGIGYWIYAQQDNTYTITGESFDSYTAIVTPGWYLIGAVNSDTASIEPNNIIVNKYIYQGINYNIGTKDYGYIEQGTLRKGEGYWVKISSYCQTTPCVITVAHDPDAPSINNLSALPDRLIRADWLVPIKVINTDFPQESYIEIGMGPEKKTFKYDDSLPDGNLAIKIYNPMLQNAYSKCILEPEGLTSYTWEIEVSLEDSTVILQDTSEFNISLQWRRDELPENGICILQMLTDTSEFQTVINNMKNQSSYSFVFTRDFKNLDEEPIYTQRFRLSFFPSENKTDLVDIIKSLKILSGM